MTIPLPRPLGIASDAETIVVDLCEPVDGEVILARMIAEAPPGMTMTGARRLATGERLLPDVVRYRLDFAGEVPDDLQQRITETLSAKTIPLNRLDPDGRNGVTLDVRPYIVELLADDSAAYFRLKVTGRGTARPAEIAGLLGFPATSINHQIRRLEVQWQ